MDTSLPVPEAQSQATQLPPPQSHTYLAPWWHTLLLVAFLLAFSAMGSAGHPNLTHSMRMRLYYSTIVMEWLMVLYVFWGLRLRRQTTLRDLIGGRWNKPEDFLMDVVYAIGFRIASAIIVALALGGIHFGSGKELQERLQSVYPDGVTEQLVFQFLCLTAGFCEELIYRGYFQKQFSILLRSSWLAITAQAVIFGASHAYQGLQGMIIVGVLGFLFGVLAHWRKSLRPGMIAHFSQDSIAGLFWKIILRHADKMLQK